MEQKQFNELGQKMFQQYVEVQEIKEHLKREQEKLTKFQGEYMKCLENMEMDRATVPKYGTVSLVTKYSVKTPKDVPSKEALWNYIEAAYGKEVLKDYLTINSQSLNSFYKKEFEIAKEEGNLDWILPGVGEPTAYKQLTLRRS